MLLPMKTSNAETVSLVEPIPLADADGLERRREQQLAGVAEFRHAAGLSPFLPPPADLLRHLERRTVEEIHLDVLGLLAFLEGLQRLLVRELVEAGHPRDREHVGMVHGVAPGLVLVETAEMRTRGTALARSRL